MDQPPPFEGSHGLQPAWNQALSDSDDSSGGASLRSDSIMSDNPSEEEDEDPYSNVEFSDHEASAQDFLQLSSHIRTDARKLGRTVKQTNDVANQVLLNGTELNAAGKSYYSQRLEDVVAQTTAQIGEFRSRVQVMQSSPLFAEGRLAQSEVNERHHELERVERSLARQQDALERRLVRLSDERETLRDDRDTLEQQQNVLEADQLNFQIDCVEYNNNLSEFEDAQAEMRREQAKLVRQVDTYNELAEEQDQTRDYLEQKKAELQRREAALAEAQAAAREQEQRLAAERARMVSHQRSVAEASELVPQLQQWVGQGRTIFERAEQVLEGLQGALTGPQQAMPPQGHYTHSMARQQFQPMAPEFPPAAHLFHGRMQHHAGSGQHWTQDGQHYGPSQQENFWLDPNQGLDQQGAQSVLSPYLKPFGELQPETVYTVTQQQQGLQGAQSSLSPYLRPFDPVQQRPAYTAPEQMYGYNVPIVQQQQHWFPTVRGSSAVQPPLSNEQWLAANFNDGMGSFSNGSAEENVPPQRYRPEQNASFHDKPEHFNRAPALSEEPRSFGPFELDAQQDGSREVSGHSHYQEAESRPQDTDEVDLIDLGSDPNQDNQMLINLDESDGDSDSDSDDEAPVNHDFDGTYRNLMDGVEGDVFEDDVDPIDID